VPTVIILSAVAWFTFYSYQKVLGDLAVKQDWAVVYTKSERALLAVATLINSSTQRIALDIDTDPSLSLETRAQKILDHAPNLNIFDGGIYFVNQQGEIFRTQPERPELIGQDWSDTPQFRYVRDTPAGYSPQTDIRVIGSNEEKIVCVIWPMHNPERVFIGAGYYCFAVEPTEQSVLYKTLNNLSLGASVYIIDGKQRIVFSPDPSQVGKDLSKVEYIQQLLQGQSMSIRFQKGTQDMLVSYNPFANTITDRNRWVVISEQSWSDIMEPSLPYRQLLLVLLALGVIVPVLVTVYGVRHLSLIHI
jgi:hypothetical protein